MARTKGTTKSQQNVKNFAKAVSKNNEKSQETTLALTCLNAKIENEAADSAQIDTSDCDEKSRRNTDEDSQDRELQLTVNDPGLCANKKVPDEDASTSDCSEAKYDDDVSECLADNADEESSGGKENRKSSVNNSDSESSKIANKKVIKKKKENETETRQKTNKALPVNNGALSKSFNIEKLLDSGKILSLKKGELKLLVTAKNIYKTEIKASLMKKKKEILENLKKENDKVLASIPKNVYNGPYISFLIGMKNYFAGNKIITKGKIDTYKKKPSVTIKIGDETIVIDDTSFDKQKVLNSGQTNLNFVNRIKNLYEDYFGRKKIKK